MGAQGAGRSAAKGGGGAGGSLWFATNPSKRWGETFFMLYTPFWLTLCLGIIVPYKLYESFTEFEYLLVGLVSAVPSLVIPLLFIGKADKGKCWKDRYWVKANLWIIIFSYVGNYFWTHYFFKVLGASYTFPSWKMNDVPHTTFLLAHVCFLFYHVASNLTLRRLRHSIAHLPQTIRIATEAAWVLALAYFIAYLETLAISNERERPESHLDTVTCLDAMGHLPDCLGSCFTWLIGDARASSDSLLPLYFDHARQFPYYQFTDRASMYRVGSLFYAIYFIVSFPMFLRVDEKPGDPWDLGRVAVDALGAAMLVTIILDLWRIFLGPIVPVSDLKQCSQVGLPWFR